MENSFVFISYSRADGYEHAIKLSNKLKKQGFNIWMDQSNLEPGKIWGTAIGEALQNCKCVVFIATRKSVASTNVVNEIDYALDNGKKVIPVQFDDCNLPFRVHALQRIDFTKKYDSAFARLVNAINDAQVQIISSPRKPNRVRVIVGGLVALLVICFIIFLFKKPKVGKYSANPPIERESQLRNIGGAINQAVVYNRYEDVVPYMVPEMRSVVTKKAFTDATDTISHYVGRFLQPIDTAYRKANGNEIVVIRNQFEKGVATTQMMFLNEGTMIFGLFTGPDRTQ